MSRMMSEETNPPDALFDSVINGDYSLFHEFGECKQDASSDIGFKTIIENICKDSELEIPALIHDIRNLIYKDPKMDVKRKEELIKLLLHGIWKEEIVPHEDRESRFLFECFKYTLAHGNNAFRRLTRQKAQNYQKKAKEKKRPENGAILDLRKNEKENLPKRQKKNHREEEKSPQSENP